TSYLTRFLINYDPATKELWAARSKIIEDQGAYSLPFFGTNKDDLVRGEGGGLPHALRGARNLRQLRPRHPVRGAGGRAGA
ncbi:unnamed protein product, partial [Heterosigma akashiwo]